MKGYWVIGIAMVAGMHAQASDCDLNVYVLTGVPMPAGMLLDATKRATAMFREIGVKVIMREGVPGRESKDGCGGPIVIQIEDSNGYNGPSAALAYAMPYRQAGTCIHIFLDRVRLLDSVEMSRDPRLANSVLAHVMAHEITHQLEQSDRHSKEGVMKSRWSRHDYDGMARQSLPFAPEDVELIHKGLRRRSVHSMTNATGTA